MTTLVFILAMVVLGFAFVSFKASHWSNLVSGVLALTVFGLMIGFNVFNPITAFMYLGVGILAIALWLHSKRK